MILLAAYIIITAVAIFLSFIFAKGAARKASRIAALALITPLVLVVVAIFAFIRFSAPPTLAHLGHTFPDQRHDLESLLAMFAQDARFSRIDPEFLDQMGMDGKFQGRYMVGDPHVALPEARWNEYRQIFKRNHLDQGIERDTAGDVFFRSGAQGLLDRGYATGIVFCRSNSVAVLTDFRYEPCVKSSDDGADDESITPHREGFEFHRLSAGWFTYKQGPG